MSLIVGILGTDNGTTVLETIVRSKEFTHTIILTDSHAAHSTLVGAEFLSFDFTKPVEQLVVDFHGALQKKFSEKKIAELDIAVCLASGTGKEHAALLSALMKLGYGIRLIDVDATGELIEL